MALPRASKQSESILQRNKVKKYVKLFRAMDEHCMGQISMATARINFLPESIIKIIWPLLLELGSFEDGLGGIDCYEFVQALIRLDSCLTPGDRSLLLNWDKPPVPDPVGAACTFKPRINKVKTKLSNYLKPLPLERKSGLATLATVFMTPKRSSLDYS
jgi:hypothetical protein